MKGKRLPGPITILMAITILAALGTWLMPAGQYDTISSQDGSFRVHSRGKELRLPLAQHSLDSLHILIKVAKFSSGAIRKAVSIPGTYHRVPQNGQGFTKIIQAPIQGLYDAADIIFFVLFIGGFMNIFNRSGALEKALMSLSHNMKGREKWLIILLTFLFSFAGASYGMAEEALAFYPVVIPLFLAAGYDLLLPVAVIFGGTQLGSLASFSNPFATIIASNVAGVNWTDGLAGRIAMFAVSTLITIGYISVYGKRIRKNPQLSLVRRTDGAVIPLYENPPGHVPLPRTLDRKTKGLLWIFFLTFCVMIAGVVFLDWWMTQMSAVFLVSAVLIGIIQGMPEREFIEKFIGGAQSLLAVSFIVGVARGITIILNNGMISDTILYYSAQLVRTMPPALFILILLILYSLFTLFISSSSAMAVVTMPIMGSLALIAGVPGREIVNAYLYGMGIMGFITPVGLILPSLALVNVSLKAWIKFIFPLMVILFVLCALFLVIGIRI